MTPRRLDRLLIFRRCGCDASITVHIPVLDAPEVLAIVECWRCGATWAVTLREAGGR